MKHPLYAIRDVLTRFLAPMVDDNDNSAIRNFKLWVNQNGLADYSPSDFELYRVGVFDSDSGTIDPVYPAEFVVSGSSVFEKPIPKKKVKKVEK